MKEYEQKNLKIEKEKSKLVKKNDLITIELSQTKQKVMESEYAAFCLTLEKEGLLDLEPQRVQLIMRKTCTGQGVLVIEDRLGHSKKIRTDQITDVEPDLSDPRGIILRYVGGGLIGRGKVEKYYSDVRSRVLKYMKHFIQGFIVQSQFELDGEEGESVKALKALRENSEYPKVAIERNILTDLRSLFIG